MTAGKLASTNIRVRRLDAPLRSPTTPLERRVLAAIAIEGALPLDVLVDRIAGDLYRDELRHGGWVAEIGFVGRALFRSDVQRAIEGAAGILWTTDAPLTREG
jgi:hypothetical protein